MARTKAFYGVDNRKPFTQLTRAVKKFLSLLQSVWQALRLNHPTQELSGTLPPRAIGSEREYNHFPISSAHIRSTCRCTSTSPYKIWGAKIQFFFNCTTIILLENCWQFRTRTDASRFHRCRSQNNTATLQCLWSNVNTEPVLHLKNAVRHFPPAHCINLPHQPTAKANGGMTAGSDKLYS